MKYIASVTLDGELKLVTEKYPSKAKFYSDLRCNGYKVRFISTEDRFNWDCEKYHQKIENQKKKTKKTECYIISENDICNEVYINLENAKAKIEDLAKNESEKVSLSKLEKCEDRGIINVWELNHSGDLKHIFY